MHYRLSMVGALLVSLAAATAPLAEETFADHMNDCVDRYVHSNNGGKVVLDCTAKDGKTSDCKVVENSAPGLGYDKAATCVADALPLGSKTGAIRIPILFPARS